METEQQLISDIKAIISQTKDMLAKLEKLMKDLGVPNGDN